MSRSILSDIDSGVQKQASGYAQEKEEIIIDIITGKILKLNNWPDGKIIGIAKDTAAQLMNQGMDREAALARLEAVRKTPAASSLTV
ncbi:MAG: hypothetical protein ACYC6R_10780 [Anaerolineales bacterium]